MRHILTVIAICIVIPSASQASIFKSSNVHVKAARPVVPAKCTEFSGDWKGTCATTNVDGSTGNYSMQTKITQQGCSRLYTDGGIFEIGVIEGETHAEYANLRAFDWNSDGTQLKAIETGISSTLSSSSDSPDVIVTDHHIVSIEANLKLDNGKLMVTETSNSAFKATCTLDKQ